jgi:predicted permease
MQLMHDLRYAIRNLAREKSFTAIAILTLGLAIGANTAIFSVASGLLLRPLPLPNSNRLVILMRSFKDGETDSISVPKYFFFHERLQQDLSSAAAYEKGGTGFNLVGDGLPERLRGTLVSAEFFQTLGVTPVLGRNFLAEEDRPGARHVVILSHDLWQRRFGGDPKILNRPLKLNGETYTVIGIAPASFRFPSLAELWTPFCLDRSSTNEGNYFQFIGRLRDGTGLEASSTHAKALTHGFDAAFPKQLGPTESFKVVALQDHLYGRVRPALLVLLAAVVAVLLIACVNIANLQLARGAARQREIAIRAALGASSRRIVGQLLTESLLLALLGGLAGLALGAACVRPLVAISPIQIDRLAEVGIDGRVLAFTLVVSLAAGLLSGLAPALQAARSNLNAPLKEGSNRSVGSVGSRWVRRVLVVSEVALALVLISAASLLVHSFVNLMEKAPGFESSGVLTMKLSLPPARYNSTGSIERFGHQVVERLEALPGVQGATLMSSLPFEGGPDLTFTIVGRPTGGDDGQGGFDADYHGITADYFKTLRIPLLRGRVFSDADRVGAPLVALVNAETARRAWPNQDPIGQHIIVGAVGTGDLSDRGIRTIVGVVASTHDQGVDRETPMILYVPLAQMPESLMGMLTRLLPLNVALRTAAPSAALTAAAEKQIWAVDPSQPISDVRTLEEIRGRSLGARRFTTTLLGLMALLALALAAVGIYGVLSYLVSQRTREIGVRMALGASSTNVLRLVIRQGMGAVLVGIAIGLAGALALPHALGSLLVGFTWREPFVFILTPVALATIAVLASAIPALRASQLDPLVALRQE